VGCVSYAHCRCCIREGGDAPGVVALVEKELVGPVFPQGGAYVDVVESVSVHVYYSHAVVPAVAATDACGFTDVFEFPIAPVQVQFVFVVAAAEEKIFLAVLVKISNPYAAAVIDVLVGQDVEAVTFTGGIGEGYTGLFFIQAGEDGCLLLAGGKRENRA